MLAYDSDVHEVRAFAVTEISAIRIVGDVALEWVNVAARSASESHVMVADAV